MTGLPEGLTEVQFQRAMNPEAAQAAERYAPLAHHLIAALCVAFGDPPQPAWKDAPEADRKSTVDALVEAITHPDRTPRQEHERWADAKRKDGWVYGPVKDKDAKPPTHPLLVDYDDPLLLPAQKVKDVLFVELGAAIREGRLP